jgi:hypothetical protein
MPPGLRQHHTSTITPAGPLGTELAPYRFVKVGPSPPVCMTAGVPIWPDPATQILQDAASALHHLQ